MMNSQADMKEDPVAFFERITKEPPIFSPPVMNENGITHVPNNVNKQLLNNRSLKTLKPPSSIGEQKENPTVYENNNQTTKDDTRRILDTTLSFVTEQEFTHKWSEITKSYRIEKRALSEQLQRQIMALAEVEEHFETANIALHRKMTNSYRQILQNLDVHRQNINIEKKQFERGKVLIQEVRKLQDEKVKLNVGGQIFVTSLSTLRKDPNSMLAQMFSGYPKVALDDTDNAYFIDRDSTYFRLVLNYLRDLRITAGVVDDPKIMDELMQEASFYKLNGLLRLKWENLPRLTQEKLYELYPIRPQNDRNSDNSTIITLKKMDLSNLDFSNYLINPKSSFKGSNLENCRFASAKFEFDFDHQVDFSDTLLLGATFPREGTDKRASGKA